MQNGHYVDITDDVTSLLYGLTDSRTSRKFENCAMLIDSLGYYAVINYVTMDIYNNFRCKIELLKKELVERNRASAHE